MERGEETRRHKNIRLKRARARTYIWWPCRWGLDPWLRWTCSWGCGALGGQRGPQQPQQQQHHSVQLRSVSRRWRRKESRELRELGSVAEITQEWVRACARGGGGERAEGRMLKGSGMSWLLLWLALGFPRHGVSAPPRPRRDGGGRNAHASRSRAFTRCLVLPPGGRHVH